MPFIILLTDILGIVGLVRLWGEHLPTSWWVLLICIAFTWSTGESLKRGRGRTEDIYLMLINIALRLITSGICIATFLK